MFKSQCGQTFAGLLGGDSGVDLLSCVVTQGLTF